MLISVIIPALDEGGCISRAIKRALAGDRVEVIVADGGSVDDTLEVAASLGAGTVTARRGRARQMNAGAELAAGDALLFLHADTILPDGYDGLIRAALSDTRTIAGAFGLSVDSDMRGMRIIERLANWRSERLGLPYGDQGIFVRREVFHAIGGFPDLPIMEDFELMLRLRTRGAVAHLPAFVVTSARRWERHGLIRTTLVNQAVIAGYMLGVNPERLNRWYG